MFCRNLGLAGRFPSGKTISQLLNVRMGEAEFARYRPCTRCIVTTTVSPDSGVKNKDFQPLRELRKCPVVFGILLSARDSAKLGEICLRRGVHTFGGNGHKHRPPPVPPKQPRIHRGEVVPQGLFKKFKFYWKRYFWVLLPVHCVCCAAWFAALYFLVKIGINVVAIMEFMHIPESLIEKVKKAPPNASYAVAALILYKVATPLRYATTLLFTVMIVRWKGASIRTTREMALALNKRRVEFHKQFRELRDKRRVKKHPPRDKEKE